MLCCFELRTGLGISLENNFFPSQHHWCLFIWSAREPVRIFFRQVSNKTRASVLFFFFLCQSLLVSFCAHYVWGFFREYRIAGCDQYHTRINISVFLNMSAAAPVKTRLFDFWDAVTVKNPSFCSTRQESPFRISLQSSFWRKIPFAGCSVSGFTSDEGLDLLCDRWTRRCFHWDARLQCWRTRVRLSKLSG